MNQLADAVIETTRERIARVLRDMAAEDQPTVLGKTIQMAYSMGMGGAIVDALPEEDAAADAQLEYLAGVVLALRSASAIARNPFEPVFGEADALDVGDQADDLGPHDRISRALGVNEGEVTVVFAAMGLGAVALADLENLRDAMLAEPDVETWGGVTFPQVEAAITEKRSEPDVPFEPDLPVAEPYREAAE